MTITTREEARQAFAGSGVVMTDILTRPHLEDLRRRIDVRMKAAELMPCSETGKPSYRMRRTVKIMNVPSGPWAELRCKAYYFDDRQAVTFESANGFIGFAGWASDDNVAPIVEAFLEWLDALARPVAQAA